MLSAARLPDAVAEAEGPVASRRVEAPDDRAPAEIVVSIRGEAPAVAAQAVEAGLLLPWALRGARITLDLSELASLSCLAMRALVVFYRGVVRRGGQVRLRPVMRPHVREALERAGLLHLFGRFKAPDSSADNEQ